MVNFHDPAELYPYSKKGCNIRALIVPRELANAWHTAWEAGPKWREKLEDGNERLPAEVRGMLADLASRHKPKRRKQSKTD